MDKPLGFVALKSIKQGPPDPKMALAQIREIYFKTTKKTIEHDITHAIELLKSLPSEDERDKAAVYMHGLQEMRHEWKTDRGGEDAGRKKKKKKGAKNKPKA